MDLATDVVLVAAGAGLILAVVDSALRTFVLPRAARTPITRFVFVGLRMVFDLIAWPAHSYERRDRVMALYAPSASSCSSRSGLR